LLYALYLFSTAFYDLRMGYASAMAWLLFVLIVALTLLATTDREENSLWDETKQNVSRREHRGRRDMENYLRTPKAFGVRSTCSD
jgi:multiple sugar transport system permease protein